MLLYGILETLLHRLHVVQNSAARLIMRVRQREHITPILFALHWLPVRQRIQFKILTLVYRCQNHQAPAYLSTCITPYAPGRSLRSSDHGLLMEHRYRLERYGRFVSLLNIFNCCYLLCFYNYFTMHFNVGFIVLCYFMSFDS